MLNKTQKDHYQQLDVFRALAALSVSAVHFDLNSFFYNYFANGLFVQLFFTLSGFVIFLNYYQNIDNHEKFKVFIKKRFKRLYPLHLFFLLIFLFMEIIKYIVFIKFGMEVNNKPFSTNNLNNFLLNLFFIQHFADVFNFNSPSWSISVEMMLYLTIGVIFLYFNRFMYLIFIFYIAIFLLYLNGFYGNQLSYTAYFSGLYSFFIGCIFCYIFLKTKLNTHNVFFNIFYIILISILFLEFYYFKTIDETYLYSIFFGLIFFLSWLLDKESFISKMIFNKFFIFLGRISYSIYMSHLFVFWTIKFFLLFILKVPTTNIGGKIILDLSYFYSNLITIFVFIVTIFLSYFSYKHIEMRFYKK